MSYNCIFRMRKASKAPHNEEEKESDGGIFLKISFQNLILKKKTFKIKNTGKNVQIVRERSIGYVIGDVDSEAGCVVPQPRFGVGSAEHSRSACGLSGALSTGRLPLDRPARFGRRSPKYQ